MAQTSRTEAEQLPGRLSRLHRDRKGQAALEFLLVIPFAIMGILLIVDSGLTMFQYVTVSNAVREGARFGAVNCGTGTCTTDGVIDRTLQRSAGILTDPGDVSVGWTDTTGDGTNSGKGDAVTVQVEHVYDFLFFPVNFPIVSCADMRLEQRDRGSGLPSGTEC